MQMFVGDDVSAEIQLNIRLLQELRVRDETDKDEQSVCSKLFLLTVLGRFDAVKFVVFDDNFISCRTDMDGNFALIDILLQLFLQDIAGAQFTAHQQINMASIAS